jgi:iron complex outermembrane receptor protein
MEDKIEYNPTDVLKSQNPRHQVSLRTSLDLPGNLMCDVWYRYVDRLSSTIGGYDTMDVRFAWKYSRNLEISVVGQNLLKSHHAEYQSEEVYVVGTEVERGVYGKIVWRFD